jgi:peptidyl-prolyl cis-trans isomerase D
MLWRTSRVLDSFRKGQRWLTLFIVGTIGVVFVFFMGWGGGGSPQRPAGSSVVELADIHLDVTDFQRMRTRQESIYRERLGDQFDSRAARSFLDSSTLSSLVDGAILAASASELGLRVSKEEVQHLVRSSSSFRNEAGAFDREAFESFARYEYGSQRAFLDVVRNDLLAQKLTRLLYAQASVSEAEARSAALHDLQEVRIAWVGLGAGNLPVARQPDEAAVQSWLEGHREELLGVYQQRIEEFQTPEKVRARHILLRLALDADEATVESVRTRAEAARGRLLAGEAFEDLASELSEDPGSSSEGGDLGFFARGERAPALEQAAFALQPGDLSDVIRSDAGFHLIRVEERMPASSRSFDEVGPQLARDGAMGEAARRFADEIATAVAAGASLEDAARERDLTLERTGLLTRRPDGYVPGLGGSPDLMAAAFALLPESPSLDRVFAVGPRFVLIQLLERKEPDAQALEDATLARRTSLLDEKRARMVRDWLEARRQSLLASGELRINSELVFSGS